MNALRLLPAVLSCLLLAAHFLRAGNLPLVAACVVAPAVLLLRRTWVPRLMQLGLVFAGGVWVWTASDIVRTRMMLGQPWSTAALILGGVALWTLGAGVLFETTSLRRRYRRLPG